MIELNELLQENETDCDYFLDGYRPIARYRMNQDFIEGDAWYENFYKAHVHGMTEHELNSKAEIAHELAQRDYIIVELMRRLDLLPNNAVES